MNKLTIRLRDPNVVRSRRAQIGEAIVAATASASASARRGLVCIWKMDEATGRLYCTWLADDEQNRTCVRHRGARTSRSG
jgi:hypothetical protein